MKLCVINTRMDHRCMACLLYTSTANIPEKLLLYRRHDKSVSNQNRNLQKLVATKIANEVAIRRNININTKSMQYSNDWHNKCFYANYEEKLKGKKIIFIADSYLSLIHI